MSRLFLMRHGLLLSNPQHRFVGQLDIPLSAEGRAQASFWRKELHQIHFVRVISSDLSRCVETASLIIEGRDLALESLPDFREISLGAWQGLTKAEVEARFPGVLEARGRDFWNFVPEKGESFAMLEQRVLPALRPILAGIGQNEDLLLVAHAAVNRVILRRWMALPESAIFDISPQYASCAILDFSSSELDWLTIS